MLGSALSLQACSCIIALAAQGQPLATVGCGQELRVAVSGKWHHTLLQGRANQPVRSASGQALSAVAHGNDNLASLDTRHMPCTSIRSLCQSWQLI